LGRWGFLALIIVLKFWQDDHSFLLGDIGSKNLNPLPFQVHFRWVHDLLRLTTQICILPFEQFSKKGTNCFQDNILKKLHEHSFSNIISEVSFNCHCT
jgi:hypothetical protein